MILPLACFPTANKKRDGTYGRRSRCPECHRARDAAYPSRASGRVAAQKRARYEKLRRTARGRAKLRRQNRESQARRRALSAEARAGARAASLRYQRKRASTPEGREAENRRHRDRRAWLKENDPDGWVALLERDRRSYRRRMRFARARRRKRETARLAEANRRAQRLGSGYVYRPRGPALVDEESTIWLPVEPFRDYVEEKLAVEGQDVFGAEENLGGPLTAGQRFLARIGGGTDPRVLYRWRHELQRVDLDDVDRVLTAYEEPFLLDVLYPDIDARLAVA